MNNRSYVKLYATLLDSSLWAETGDGAAEKKVVWITLLAMADRQGQVFASLPALARNCGVTMDACYAALQAFQQPDPYSRTKDNDGRRLEEVDGGWRLLNYEKYREIQGESTERVRKWRENKRNEKQCNVTCNDVTADPEADPDTDLKAEDPREQRSTQDPSKANTPGSESGKPVSVSAEKQLGGKPTRRGSEPRGIDDILEGVASADGVANARDQDKRRRRDLYRGIRAVTQDSESWLQWWSTVVQALPPDGLLELEEHLSYAKDCQNESTAQLKGLGHLKKPGGYLVSKLLAWSRSAGFRLPDTPKLKSAG